MFVSQDATIYVSQRQHYYGEPGELIVALEEGKVCTKILHKKRKKKHEIKIKCWKLRVRTAYIGNLVAIRKRNNHTERLWIATVQME